MSQTHTSAPPPHDAKGRIIAIFVGAVLLPSLALSYVSIALVPKLATQTRMSEIKRAERALYYVEKDLQHAAEKKALEAAQVVGTDRLLDGRPEVIQAALHDAGMDADVFEELHRSLVGLHHFADVSAIEVGAAQIGQLRRHLLLSRSGRRIDVDAFAARDLHQLGVRALVIGAELASERPRRFTRGLLLRQRGELHLGLAVLGSLGHERLIFDRRPG